MYTYKISTLPKRSSEITISVPKEDILKEKEFAFKKLQDELTIEGFRKGKVPKEMAEKHISSETVYQEVLQSVLPKAYEEIVKKESLHPIMNPKIELTKVKENEDWEIKLVIASKPTVNLEGYKEAIKKAKADHKKSDIWVPGKDKEQKKDENAEKQKMLNEVLTALLKAVKFEIADMVLEEELNKRLSQLMDDIRKIGLTVDAYMRSKNTTIEEVTKRYKQEIEETYKLEFVLMEIADKEGIKVEKVDIDKLLNSIKDEKERKIAEQNSYYYASILRKQKTLDYLLSI